jgi:hypothetical protein
VDSSLGKGFSKDFNKMWDDYTSPKSTAQRAGASGMTHIGETMGRGGGVPTVGAQIGEGLSNSKSMAGGAMKQVGSAFKPKETGPSLAGRAGGSESFGLFSGKNAPVSPSLTGGGMKATASAGGPSLLGGKFGKVKI